MTTVTRVRSLIGVAAAAVAFMGLSGCEAVGNLYGKSGASNGRSGQEAAIATPSVDRFGPRRRSSLNLPQPNFGPALGVIRQATLKGAAHNIALRGGAGDTRKYILQRVDLQPMWASDKSRDKAIAGVLEAFSGDACAGGPSAFTVTGAEHDPIGLWIIHASCAAGAPAVQG